MNKYFLSMLGAVAAGVALGLGFDFGPLEGGLLSGGIYWLRVANF